MQITCDERLLPERAPNCIGTVADVRAAMVDGATERFERIFARTGREAEAPQLGTYPVALRPS